MGHGPKWYFHLLPCGRHWRSEIFLGGSQPGRASAWTGFCHPEEMALPWPLLQGFPFSPPGQPPHSQMFPCPRTSFETPQSGDCLVGTVELTEYRNCGFSLSQDYHPVAWKAQRTHHRPRTRLIFITFSLVSKAKPFFNEQYDFPNFTSQGTRNKLNPKLVEGRK